LYPSLENSTTGNAILPVAEKCEFSRSLDKAIFFSAKKGVVFCNLDLRPLK
jgi:hypothetical protein